MDKGSDYILRNAGIADFAAIHTLLDAGDLTTAGVNAATGNYIVAIHGKQIVGVIGMERYGSDVMLRSFTVHSDFRNCGIGAALFGQALAQQKTAGVSRFYLLTNTAAAFVARFGFVKISRNEIPAPLLTSSALGATCPLSSTCMKLE